MENIVLIGFSGTGKTTTGKLLAERLGMQFTDIDIEIEQACGKSVEDIFRLSGEAYFREQEHATVRSMLQRQNTVIATGGGAVLSPDNVAVLKRCGVIVALQAPPEIILSRLENDTVARPLLNKPDRLQIIKKMLSERAEKYEIADYTVETGAFTPCGVAELLLEIFRPPVDPAPAKKMYGLIGEKLSHSLSPQIHSAIFRRLNIDAGYFLFPLRREDLPAAFTGLKLLGARGVNVTIPYKIDMIPLLDEVSAEALSIGAVNTITFGDRCTRGYNTDYAGFGLMLKQSGISPAGRGAAILGTGGAAKTVACYLRDHGAREVHMVSRTPANRSADFPVLSYPELALSPGLDLLINCTPIGMFPKAGESPLERKLVGRFAAVVDLIYNPAETKLLSDAKALGLQTCNGLTMLVGQAVAAEELWQSRKIDLAMLDTLVDDLTKTFA